MSCAEKLVAHFKGRKQAAEAMGRTTETIRLWLRDGIPLECALDVESATRKAVRAEDILHEARRSKRPERDASVSQRSVRKIEEVRA
jgi:hypothetical protein